VGPCAQRPRAKRGVIVQDFAFRGNSAANKLRNFHDHGPGRGAIGTIRTKRARAPPRAAAHRQV